MSGYRVYFGTSSGNYDQSFGTGVATGKVTSYALNGLQHGKLYYFAVTTVDSAGRESSYSNEASKLIP